MATNHEHVHWLNYLDFLPGDPSVTTSFNAVSSGVGTGLSGLVIRSSTTGSNAQGGGNKVIEKGIEVPPGHLVKGVSVAYELTSDKSFITQIRIIQLQNPPGTALVLLDDATPLTAKGPVIVASHAPAAPIDPNKGALSLSLRLDFGNIADRIVLHAVGLKLAQR